MKEIKIRAWDKETKKMLLPEHPWFNPYENPIEIAYPELLLSLRGNPIMMIEGIRGIEIIPKKKLERKYCFYALHRLER